MYERLIDYGTAVADAQDRPVDHVTARRLAIWLAARPQAPDSPVPPPLPPRTHHPPPSPLPPLPCDQVDRADLMLADLHDRAANGHNGPGQAWPETDGPRVVARAGWDPDSQTVILVLDEATASIAIFAIAAHADEREAHLREVERFSQTLPEDSYGRRNRQAIAAREKRVAARLRAVEYAYRTAIERDIVFMPPEPTRACRSTEHGTDREMELE